MEAVINQLEKALKAKDDKELRLRVEVLLDFLKSGTFQNIPTPPLDVFPKIPPATVKAQPAFKMTKDAKGDEQITYTRPEGL